MTASYWASERDGATNQATTRTAKLRKAAAIISVAPSAELWDRVPFQCLEVYGGSRLKSVAPGWTFGIERVTPRLRLGT